MIAISYIGSLIVALGYFLLATKVIANQSNHFFSLLLVGNVLLAVYSLITHSYPALLLNIGFAFFAVTTIFDNKIKAKWVNFKFFIISIIITILISLYLNYKGHYIIETLGWFSMIAGFGSYFLYSQNKVSLCTYFLTNMTVNICFSIYLFYHNNYPYMVLQILVFVISFTGVVNILRFNKDTRNKNTVIIIK